MWRKNYKFRYNQYTPKKSNDSAYSDILFELVMNRWAFKILYWKIWAKLFLKKRTKFYEYTLHMSKCET